MTMRSKRREYDRIILRPLETLAYEFMERSMTTKEILAEDGGDRTIEFYDEIEQCLRNREILRINANGRTRTGKSLMATAIALHINTLLGVAMNLNHIALDQMSFSRKIADKNVKRCCIQIDEHNAYGETGANATTVLAGMANFNEIQAKREIHQIRCSPARSDPHSNIILKTIQKDKENKMTKALLYYKIDDPSRFISTVQLLGFVKIDVSKALQQPWHKTYEKRKDLAIDLYGRIRDARNLTNAKTILTTYEKLKDSVKTRNISRDDIAVYYEVFANREGEQLSLLAKKDYSDPVYTLLKPIRNIHLIEQKIEKVCRSNIHIRLKEKMITDLKSQLKSEQELHDELLEEKKKLVEASNILMDIENGKYDNKLKELEDRVKKVVG